MLKLQFKDRRRESVWLVDERFTIGKAASNSLMIDDPSIEDMHVEIVNKSDQLSLLKKAPKGSVKVNNEEISGTTVLKENDVISLGSIELELINSQTLASKQYSQTKPADIWSLHSSASWLDKNDFVINKKMVIGRDPSNDICLALDYLSRKHVSLDPQNGRLFIEDLNSSNGTYVNGHKIQKAELKPGDKIKLDVLTFEVRGPADKTNNDPHKTIMRTASPSPQKAKAKPALANSNQQENTTTKKGQSSNRNRKRLSSEGKQAWISGKNQLKTKPENKSKKRLALTVTALIVVACGLALVFIL